RQWILPLEDGMDAVLERWQARAGEVLTVVDPEGRYFRARLLPNRREVVVFEALPPGIEPANPRRLCPVIADRERMLWILQKAVELGATEIFPLVSQRSSAHGGERHGQDKFSTWGRVVLKAARQCRRAVLPTVHPVQSLEHFFARDVAEKRAFLDVREPRTALPVWHQRHGGHPLAVLSGPEGGWNDGERQWMLCRDAVAVSVGHRVLRTETAAIAALAVLAAMDSTFT
ncbi:MAG TPA: RsmE family RNA methyltransferase, partial [Magnetococcales bacterium]|nr:RsmE family RNA methyltransferase [Magnetococcales bacterium]